MGLSLCWFRSCTVPHLVKSIVIGLSLIVGLLALKLIGRSICVLVVSTSFMVGGYHGVSLGGFVLQLVPLSVGQSHCWLVCLLVVQLCWTVGL